MKTVFDPVIIDSKNLRIRPLSETTWEKLADGLLYENSWHGTMWNINRPEDVQKMYMNGIQAFENKRGNPIVFLGPDSEVLGMTNFMNCEPQNRLLEIGGTWISKKWQRTFVNTETKYLLLRYCFETLNLVRVEFRIDQANKQSQKAIERLGIHFEGVLRNRRINLSGEPRDYHFYSVIDSEWPQTKSHIAQLMASATSAF